MQVKTFAIVVVAPALALAPVPSTLAAPVIPHLPQAPMALGLGDLTGILDQFMPMLDGFLKDYMGGFFGDNFGLFQTVFDKVFGQLLGGGSFGIGDVIGSTIGPAAGKISEATGINQPLVQQGLNGALRGNGEQVLNTGLAILGQYLKPSNPLISDGDGTIGNGLPTTTNPNGTESGTGTGGLPTGTGGGGTGGVVTTGGTATGNLSCAYMSSCVGSLPSVYPKIFADAKGDLGIPDPNYVRGKIYDAAESGLLPDNFVSNPSTGAFFVANEVDRQLTRASAGAYLSKEGQAAEKRLMTPPKSCCRPNKR